MVDGADNTAAEAEKTCGSCCKLLPIGLFHKNKGGKLGVHSVCKQCKNEAARRTFGDSATIRIEKAAYRQANKETLNEKKKIANHTARRRAGRVEVGAVMQCLACDKSIVRTGPKQKYCHECGTLVIQQQQKAWSANNAGKESVRRRTARQINLQAHREYDRVWSQKNRARINLYERNRMRDPKKRLDKNMSRSIRSALAGRKSGSSWEALLGYTMDDLVSHLEGLFRDGMTWGNYGKWHIDHIIPVSAFNYSESYHIDFNRAWGLKNLQPMWGIDNQIKSDKLNEPFQPSLQL